MFAEILWKNSLYPPYVIRSVVIGDPNKSSQQGRPMLLDRSNKQAFFNHVPSPTTDIGKVIFHRATTHRTSSIAEPAVESHLA